MENDLTKIYRDLNLLAPRVAEKVNDALAECHSMGFNVYVFESWRSIPRQKMLYEKGRTTPGKKATKALPGFSMHHYGLAVDLAFKDAKNEWTWEGAWDKVQSVFIPHGFDEPPSFEESHFQISDHLSASKIRGMAEMNTVQGLWVIMGLI